MHEMTGQERGRAEGSGREEAGEGQPQLAQTAQRETYSKAYVWRANAASSRHAITGGRVHCATNQQVLNLQA